MNKAFHAPVIQTTKLNRQTFGFNFLLRIAAILLLLLYSLPGLSQLSYTGGVYSQNFDGLPTTGTFTVTGAGPFDITAAPLNVPTMTGWQFTKISGSGGNATFVVGTGSGNGGAA
ncbi:MAG: hypothetical protein WBB36_14440, partial [Chitinophagales bacterium]